MLDAPAAVADLAAHVVRSTVGWSEPRSRSRCRRCPSRCRSRRPEWRAAGRVTPPDPASTERSLDRRGEIEVETAAADVDADAARLDGVPVVRPPDPTSALSVFTSMSPPRIGAGAGVESRSSPRTPVTVTPPEPVSRFDLALRVGHRHAAGSGVEVERAARVLGVDRRRGDAQPNVAVDVA